MFCSSRFFVHRLICFTPRGRHRFTSHLSSLLPSFYPKSNSILPLSCFLSFCSPSSSLSLIADLQFISSRITPPEPALHACMHSCTRRICIFSKQTHKHPEQACVVRWQASQRRVFYKNKSREEVRAPRSVPLGGSYRFWRALAVHLPSRLSARCVLAGPPPDSSRVAARFQGCGGVRGGWVGAERRRQLAGLWPWFPSLSLQKVNLDPHPVCRSAVVATRWAQLPAPVSLHVTMPGFVVLTPRSPSGGERTASVCFSPPHLAEQTPPPNLHLFNASASRRCILCRSRQVMS